MLVGKFINNIKTRRKGSMLQDSLSKFKYFVLLALLFVVPMQAKAGIPNFDPIDQTDFGGNRLVYFYDTIDRQTIIQVTNTTTAFVNIHVQVFNATNNCEEFNFETTLTPKDSNVYDIENLPGAPDFSDSTGFVVISAFNSVPLPLIGTFRIIDDSGYEYRTNAADTQSFPVDDFADYVLNFNDVNGHDLSDVVGLTYVSIDPFQVVANAEIGSLFGDPVNYFPPLNFDEFEMPISCEVSIFKCQADGPYSLNKGIDNSIPNSHGYPRICNSSRLSLENSAGWLFMPFTGFVCQGESLICDDNEIQFPGDPYFVGYLGLNNGDGTGSMDSWWGVSFFEGLDGIGDQLTEAN
jgi:hypothetical protein